MSGFILTRQEPAGRWGVATYALKQTDVAEDHRAHREHGVTDAPCAPCANGCNGCATEVLEAPPPPMPPIPPIPSQQQAPGWRGRM